MDRTKLAYWESRARWLSAAAVPPPNQPTAEDFAGYAARLRACAERVGERPLDALMLGATGGIATLRWPVGTRLVAVDWSPGMIAKRWPAKGAPPGSTVVRGDWREMPLRDQSIDLAIGDGCYAALANFSDCRLLHDELARVLRADGWVVTRAFLRPERPEPVDALFEDLHSGRIGNLAIFRWRLIMALHGRNPAGARTGDVFDAWQARIRDAKQVIARNGWHPASLALMDSWKNAEVRVPLPTLSEVCEMIAPGFELLDCAYPAYELGRCCPILVLRPRGAHPA
jgi:SAM-dependent methyltransferase